MNIETLSKEWIEAQESEKKSSGENHWSIDYVIDLALDGDPNELWEFIKHTYKQTMSDSVVAAFAAGPLEDLLGRYGEKYIDEIEVLARKDPKFKDLLGGVWQNAMSDSLWKRVCSIRGEAW